VKVVVADRVAAGAVARLKAAGHQVTEIGSLQGPELIEALRGARGLIVRGATKVTGDVLRASPELRVVVRAGTGTDNIDAATAAERGVRVLNTPAANAVSVAELAWGMLLAQRRRLVDAAADLRAGRWEKSKYAGAEVAGKALGLVGFGRIAREVARRARGFDVKLLACDPLIAAWPAGFPEVERTELNPLLERSDFVSLHVPLEPGTRGLIGAAELSRMKPGAVIVNCARGGVVDEAALEAALRSGKLGGACLDVFAEEPTRNLSLLSAPGVIATPHIGASTREAQERAGDEAAELLIEALAKVEVG
jgi:D-3-phosphoglycerate dehydrogenase